MQSRIFEEDDNLFGLSMKKERISFYAPPMLLKNLSRLNKFDELDLLKKYVYILKMYANSKTENTLYFREENKSTPLDIIEAYLNIVNDYIQNGDFSIFLKLNNKKPNQINWNKTIRDNDVIIEDNQILYGSFQSNGKKINNDDVFFKLYLTTLNDATTMFLNGPVNDVTSRINEKEALYYINKYIDTHFRDRELFIAKQLKKIYSDRNISTINESLFPIKYHENFEHIFQFLVEENIKEKSFKKEKRNGNYIEKDTGTIVSGMSLRLDHFIKINNHYYILDSKYYKNTSFDSTPNGLPKTADIIKQVGYKLYISQTKNIDCKKIDNVFIFPSMECDSDLDYFADHKVIDDHDGYFSIKCIKINVEDLIKNFIDRKTNFSLLNLISSFNK